MPQFDKALELRNVSDGAETSSANETGKALDVLHIGDFEVVAYITAIDAASSNETYAIIVRTDSLAAFSDTPVTVATVSIPRTTAVPAEVRIPLNSALIAFMDPNAAAIQVGCTLGGTSPSLTYGAYVAPTTKGNGAIADLA